MITDASGAQVANYEYTPYGSKSQVTESQVTSYLFTGKELDSTGLYYYGARYYHPELAHFTQPDPIIQNVYDPQTLNHYSYARNNPLIYTDPTGMSFESIRTGLSNFGSSIWNNFSSGISAIGNWGRQVGAGVFRGFNQTNLQGLNSIGQGLGQMGIGMNNIANTLIPQGTTLYQVLDWSSRNVLTPIYNTLTRPGYNYGMWMYQEKNFSTFLGASLDSAWAISGIAGAIESVAASGASYWRYIGPQSKPTYDSTGNLLNKTWLTRGYQPPYSNMVIAKDKLQMPYMPASVEKVNVPFWKYVAGPGESWRNTKWGSGGGIEYRVGGWYNYE